MQLIDEYGATLFTYQAPIVLDGEIKYSFRHIGNGREWSGCYVMIMPCNSDNDYVADYSWIKKVIDESDVRSFHEFMVKFINEGIDNDSQSLNDIIKKAGK